MNKTMKTRAAVTGVVAPAQMTEEQKKAKVIQFLQQKRESFSLNILCNLCKALDKKASSAQSLAMVDLSVTMADALMDKLYPIQEEETKTDE